jgi:hypothetical protein
VNLIKTKMTSVSQQFARRLGERAGSLVSGVLGPVSSSPPPPPPVGLFSFMPLLTQAAQVAKQTSPPGLLSALEQARSVIAPAVQRLQSAFGEDLGTNKAVSSFQSAESTAHYVANQLLKGTPMRKIQSQVRKMQKRASPALRAALSQGLAIGQNAVQEALQNAASAQS